MALRIARLEEARRAARVGALGAFAAAFGAALLALFALLGRPVVAPSGPLTFLDAALFALVGIGVVRCSRAGALAGLALLCVESVRLIVYSAAASGRPSFIAVALLVALTPFFVQGVRGSFAYRHMTARMPAAAGGPHDIADRMRRYLSAHWRGELSLARSFWLNLVALDVGLALLYAGLHWGLRPVVDPNLILVPIVMLSVLQLLAITPWQIVGAFRAARRHRERAGRPFWSYAAQGMLLVALALAGLQLKTTVAMMADELRFILEIRKYAGYTVVLSGADVIEVEGPIGFGLARAVEAALDEHPAVRLLRLDSGGGWVEEAERLARLIRARGLITRSDNICYSACTIAFIAGAERVLGAGARLGFHGYFGLKLESAPVRSLQESRIAEQVERGWAAFLKAGVSPAFVERLFAIPSGELWIPSEAELIAAGVLTGAAQQPPLTGR
jgi:hypothetical protein